MPIFAYRWRGNAECESTAQPYADAWPRRRQSDTFPPPPRLWLLIFALPALLLAGALLSSSDAGADDSARHDANGTADAPLRPLAVPGKPGKPEVIPFVIPNQETSGAYFLVKWTHPTGGAANHYFVRSNDNLDGGGAYTGTEGRFTKSGSIILNLSHAMRVVGTDDQTLANAGPWSDATTLNSSSATVAASSITSSGATLTVSNLPATWWYQGDQTGAQCTKVANGTSSATITGLDAGTEYTYNVYYRDTCTEDSDKAAHWDVKATFTTETTPAKPTNLTATRGNASVSLSWTAGSDGGSGRHQVAVRSKVRQQLRRLDRRLRNLRRLHLPQQDQPYRFQPHQWHGL